MYGLFLMYEWACNDTLGDKQSDLYLPVDCLILKSLKKKEVVHFSLSERVTWRRHKVNNACEAKLGSRACGEQKFLFWLEKREKEKKNWKEMNSKLI